MLKDECVVTAIIRIIDLSDTLTSSLVPLKQFPNPPIHPPTLEVEEFSWEDAEIAHPFTSYSNHLYVYPKLLKYDSQKAFPKVRADASFLWISCGFLACIVLIKSPLRLFLPIAC